MENNEEHHEEEQDNREEHFVDRIRLRNVAELNAYLQVVMREQNLQELQQYGNGGSKRKARTKKEKSNIDGAFVFTGHIPAERKKSARLAKLKPEYTGDDILYDHDFDDEDKKHKKRKSNYAEDDIENMEEVVYKPKKKSNGPRPSLTKVPSMDVEDVTEGYISKIAKGSNKVWSQDGSSCHQCRQKTMDSKTFCRSGRCVGVRGQFCGPCLKNRYGEDAHVVLKDPKWVCPPCKGICNCSICRTRQGKRPTGILAPIAQREGHKSVKDFLISLQGKGDFVDPASVPEDKEPDVKALNNLDYQYSIEGDTDDKGSYLLGFQSDSKENSCVVASKSYMDESVAGMDQHYTYYSM